MCVCVRKSHTKIHKQVNINMTGEWVQNAELVDGEVRGMGITTLLYE